MAFIELEDYLALETASRYRHEYLYGVIYAIQGEPVHGTSGLGLQPRTCGFNLG